MFSEKINSVTRKSSGDSTDRPCHERGQGEKTPFLDRNQLRYVLAMLTFLEDVATYN